MSYQLKATVEEETLVRKIPNDHKPFQNTTSETNLLRSSSSHLPAILTEDPVDK